VDGPTLLLLTERQDAGLRGLTRNGQRRERSADGATRDLRPSTSPAGRGGGIRTPDRLPPKQVRYHCATPRVDTTCDLVSRCRSRLGRKWARRPRALRPLRQDVEQQRCVGIAPAASATGPASALKRMRLSLRAGLRRDSVPDAGEEVVLVVRAAHPAPSQHVVVVGVHAGHIGLQPEPDR
jgi:hypothetical protein